jgi:hypothetical protein
LAAGYYTRVPGELHHPDFTVSKSIQAFRRETTGLRFGTTRLPSIIILPSTLMALPGPETMQLRWACATTWRAAVARERHNFMGWRRHSGDSHLSNASLIPPRARPKS